MVNVYTASGDGQVHGEADSSRNQQHEARSIMKVDSQDHKDQADVQAAATADRDASSGTVRTATRDRLLVVDAGRTRPPCKPAAPTAPAPAGAATAPDQGTVAAAGLQEPTDTAAVSVLPQQQQQDVSTSNVSPSQQRPRGWLAMLPSPTQDDLETSNMFASDARDPAASPSSSNHHLHQQHAAPSLPSLHPAAGATAEQATAATLQHPSSINRSSSSSTGVRAPRPTPLLVGCDTPPPSSSSASASSSRFSQGHVSGSPQQQPGSSGPATSNRPPTGLQNRPAALQIQPPLSPLGAGCLTPSGLLSPSSMARPYSGPPVTLDELDLEAIDGTDVGTGGSNSSSSSPVHAILRSGGLRSSRDHGDLRRTALMNQMLSPRLNMALSTPHSGPVSLFTGETRALRVAPLPGSAGSPPTATAAGAGEGEGAGGLATPTFTSTEQHLHQLLTSSVRNSRGTSPGSGASPSAAGSMCNGSSSGGSILDRSSRSLPGTPAASRYYNVAAAMVAAAGSSSTASLAPPSSSWSSSMTASPVVPQASHGAAAALLAGSVSASPRTPRSPLGVIFSPRLGGSASVSAPLHSSNSTPTALPPPLFGPGVQTGLVAASSGAVSSPETDSISSAGLQQQPGSARASFLSPAGSRLSAASPSPTISFAAALAAQQQQQQEAQQQDNAAEQQQDAETALAASTAAMSLDGGVASSVPQQPMARRPEHLPQLLRQQLQLHDTRLGPHGESPLSPSHHSAIMQQQHRGEGGLRSSPTRPTPLVSPALAAAAAAEHLVRRADAACAAAAADEAAAAACVVEDVGQLNDVHEWLDQHSWPFSYELPMHLRDTAEFARNSSSSNHENAGHGLVSILAPHNNAVSVTAAGPFGGSLAPGSSSNGSGSGGYARRYGSAAASARPGQQVQGSMEQSLAGNDGRQMLQLEQLGDLTARLERFRLGVAAERVAQAVSAAGMAGFGDRRAEEFHIADSAADDVGLAGVVDAPAASRDQVCFGTRQHSSSDGSADAAAAGISSFHMLADNRAENATAVPAPAAAARCDVAAMAPGLNTAGQGPGEAAAAACSSISAIADLQQQQCNSSRSSAVRSGSSSRVSRPSSSSNARLLSPGSHRYTAGSPAAADCCCCTCAAAPPNAAAATAAADEGGASVQLDALGASDSGAAAADKVWSAVPVAVEDAGVQLLPGRPGSSWQQQLLHDGVMPAAAVQSQQGQLRQRQVAAQLQLHAHHAAAAAAAACAGALDGGQLQVPREVDCTYVAGAGPPVAGCFHVCGMLDAAVTSTAVDADEGVAGTTGAGSTRVVKTAALSVRGLLRDGRYVLRLVASLPGVDPSSPYVQHALRELQLADDCDEAFVT